MKQKGFTLIEIMVAVSIFLVVMTTAMGAILGIFNANRKVSSLKAVMDNLNFAVETMSREMRFGTKYHCELNANALPPFTTPQDCGAGKLVSFLSSAGQQLTYAQSGNSIVESVDGGPFVVITAPEVVIKDLSFFVIGAPQSDTVQAYGIIKIQGHAGQKSDSTDTDFTIQTMVSQRIPDNLP